VLLLDQQNRQEQLLKLSLGQLDQRLNPDPDPLVLALDLLSIGLLVLVDMEPSEGMLLDMLLLYMLLAEELGLTEQLAPL